MSKQTAVEWFAEQVEQYILTHGNLPLNVLSNFKNQAKVMEREQMEENMAKAITFGWDLSHYHRLHTEEKLLQMQKDFITSVIEGGEQ